MSNSLRNVSHANVNSDGSFDYSNLIPENLRGQYRLDLHVTEPEYLGDSKRLYVELKHLATNKTVGEIQSTIEPSGEEQNVHGIHIGEMHIYDKTLKGLGLGNAMLDAATGHAFNHHNATRMYGGEHSTEASRSFASLSRRYGFDYRPTVQSKDNPPAGGAHIPPDPKFVNYDTFMLKSESAMPNIQKAILPNGRYAVYHMIPKEDGVHKHLSSVFAIKNGGFHLLEDYADIFTKYHTQDGDQPSRILEQRIHNLVNNSSYYKVIPTKEDNIRNPDSRHKMVTPEDINSGRHAFVYHSPHHNGPSQLVYDKGSFHLNGYPLSIAELKHIKESVEGGTGKVSYPEDMFKAEDNFSAIPEPDDFFDTDYMCPQIGNLHAYRNFVGGEPKGGSHIFLTSDAVKKVLEDDGVKSHNDILIAIATMLDKAASVPDESGRVFHVGHDSYYVYMPSYESGLQFLYNLQGLINEMPTIYSKHPYFDIGMSDELEEAFNALTQVGEYKEHDGEEGNHVMIHTGNTTRYVSPSDIL